MRPSFMTRTPARHWGLVGLLGLAGMIAVPSAAPAALLTFVEAKVDGVGGVAGLTGATSVAVSPDGGHVYVVSTDDAAVAVFSRNLTTGSLTFVEAKFDGQNGVN